MEMPETQYARSGDVSVAFQVFGSCPVDLVLIEGASRIYRRLGSSRYSSISSTAWAGLHG